MTPAPTARAVTLSAVRNFFRSRMSIAVFAVAVLSAACAEESSVTAGSPVDTEETIAATISDRELSHETLAELLPDGANTVPSRVANVVQTWLVTQALELELIDQGYAPTADDEAQAAEFLATGEVRTDAEGDQLLQAFTLSFVLERWTDDRIDTLDDPELPNYLCSNHLLVETEQEAIDALARFEAGEAFADLAIELSTGPTGPSGGDLGCAIEGSFVPEFEAAANEGEPGDVVGPVETQFGWHLIEIESTGLAIAENHPTADEAELALIFDQARSFQIDQLVVDLEIEAAVNYRDSATIDPAVGTFDGDGLQVVPAGS